ncbi:MAG: formate C-acetyltransferase/glycerol dehydratase family glycyl radical enzyme [Oscillospiraceae bacterium]
MTDRIKKLKDTQNKVRPSLSAERAKLATYAYERCAGEVPILMKARMLSYILENMKIYISDGELIVGNHTDKPRCAPVYPEFSSGWIIDQIDAFPLRHSDPLQVSPEDRQALLELLPKWKGRSLDEIVEAVLPEVTKNAESRGVMTVGNRDCATGHILPDYKNLINKGLGACREDCAKHIAETCVDSKEKQEQVDFWSACIIVIDAAAAFAGRYSRLAANMAEEETDPARKNELVEISKICTKVPLYPPETFYEAIQFIWFIHLVVTIETNGHGNSFGRFDQYTNKFYVDDLKAGRITEARAIEILECFFIKTTDIIKLRDSFYSESFAGYPVWQNLIVGGQTRQGGDATNAVSHLVLKANADVQTSQPTVSVRYFDGLSKELIKESLIMIQQGMATPAFFNDKLVVPIMMEKFGTDIEEAREWGIHGCVEPCIAGYTDGRPTVGYVNSLKCLELAMHDGVDPVTGEQLGVKTGDFLTFSTLDDLQNAVYTQIDYFVDLMLRGFNQVGAIHATRQQVPFGSLLTGNCIENGKSLQCGGAKYSESGAFICGIGNTADSLAAIDTLVFQKKVVDAEHLLKCLKNNFSGEEQTRLILLNKAPKYGNDDDYVDGLASDLLRRYRESISRYRDSRGGKFTAVVESQSLNVSQGKCVMASPDGRFAAQPLNDNCSPVMGRDVNGPTATVKSVSKLDQMNAQDGCLYNIRFDPRSVKGDKGRGILTGVIKTYFDSLGEHIQINVIDDETLRAAQREPENYRNLLVRVAGYLAYFTELDRDVQDNMIARTSHRV